MLFVYGTRGTAEENAWALAKARFDAETFWYRGNGSVDVVADTAFDPQAERDRNVILYGNADTNAAWTALLGDSPVQVRRGGVRVGDRKRRATTWPACSAAAARQRPGLRRRRRGSGLAGMRLTDRLPYFVSGVGYPDCLILGSGPLERAWTACAAPGFFGLDWSVKTGEFAWKQ